MLYASVEQVLVFFVHTHIHTHMQGLIYPPGLASPVRGSREIMIEMHYDNPDMTEGEFPYLQ